MPLKKKGGRSKAIVIETRVTISRKVTVSNTLRKTGRPHVDAPGAPTAILQSVVSDRLTPVSPLPVSLSPVPLDLTSRVGVPVRKFLPLSPPETTLTLPKMFVPLPPRWVSLPLPLTTLERGTNRWV